MKTMKLQERIVRVSDERAQELYMDGWQYTPKSEWKDYRMKEVKAKMDERLNSSEIEFTKTKNNKMSKSQKRHLRKKNK